MSHFHHIVLEYPRLLLSPQQMSLLHTHFGIWSVTFSLFVLFRSGPVAVLEDFAVDENVFI